MKTHSGIGSLPNPDSERLTLVQQLQDTQSNIDCYQREFERHLQSSEQHTDLVGSRQSENDDFHVTTFEIVEFFLEKSSSHPPPPNLENDDEVVAPPLTSLPRVIIQMNLPALYPTVAPDFSL